MTDNELKPYHNYCNALWKFFRKHAEDGITDANVWDVVTESIGLVDDHAGVMKRDKLMAVIVSQLLEIGERQRAGDRMIRQRIDAFFAEYRKHEQDETLWSVVTLWLNWLLNLEPEQFDYGINELRKLLEIKGHYVSTNELEAYIDAGWSLKFKN